MSFLGKIWNLYLGLLSLLGNALLILLGVGLCGYATYQQLQPLHTASTDVVLFAVGIILISFATVRRMVWSFCGLAALWCGIIWLGKRVSMGPDEMIRVTPTLLAIAGIPPFFLTLYLESVRKTTSDLEISLTEKSDSDA